MTSDYSDIRSRFFLKVDDYGLPQISDEIVDEMIAQWLHSTASTPYIRRLFSSFKIDDDVQEIKYELKDATSDDEDKEFVEEVLAEGLVVQWLRPQYRSTLNIHQAYSNSEQKFYSQAQHTSTIKEMYEKVDRDLRKMIRDRDTFCNRYILDG